MKSDLLRARAALVVAIVAVTASSPATADIVISGTGTLIHTFGPDIDGLDGTPYSFSFPIPDGSKWAAAEFEYVAAEISSPSVILNGTSVGFPNAPLSVIHRAAPSSAGIAGPGFSTVTFSAFGSPSILAGAGANATPSPASEGEPVRATHLCQDSSCYLFQLQDINGSIYNSTSTSFSITGSTTGPDSLPSLPPHALLILSVVIGSAGFAAVRRGALG